MWTTSLSQGEPDEEFYRRVSAPENEIPVPLALNLLLARRDDAAVVLTGAQVYSTGLSFELVVRIRRGAPSQVDLGQLFFSRSSGPPGMLVGMELADGRRVDNLGRGAPDHDVWFTQNGGSGGERSVEQSWWLSPLPPEGPVRVIVSCPALGIGESAAVLDGATIRRARDDVLTLWPWTSPHRGEPEPPPSPDLPDGSWFAGPA